MASLGHYGRGGGTKQGIYVCTASGKLLSSVNTLNADRVLKTLNDGLKKWAELPEEERKAKHHTDITAHRWEDNYPKGGLVLKSIHRDLPVETNHEPKKAKRWNQDHVWFDPIETRGWIPADPKKGETHRVSNLIVHRLAAFHLVDNVRGQALPFSQDEVADSWIQTEVTDRQENRITLLLTGVCRAKADGSWRLGENDWRPRGEWPRSSTAELLGRAVYDLTREVFEEFELVAHLEWNGRAWLNGRGSQKAGEVGIYFQLAPDTPTEHIPPAFIDVYDAPWIRRPVGKK